MTRRDYPQDSFDNMARLARDQGFPFPYLYDEPQTVARAYGAACTPDFFGFNADLGPAISRAAGCVWPQPGPGRHPPRAFRGDEADRRNRPGPKGSDPVDGLLDQVENVVSGIIFDLDGTLIDSAPDIHHGVNLMLAAEGLPPMPWPRCAASSAKASPR